MSPSLYRYDFHVHSAPRSPCAHSSPEALCRAALEAGLQGIAFTEHDTWWPEADLHRLRDAFSGLVILGGMEVACPEGHFLVFLPPEGGLGLDLPRDVAALAREVHARGGVVIWSHPFRFDRREPVWLDCVALDGIEVASSNMDERSGFLARQVANARRLLSFRNSDAHHVDALGRFATELSAKVRGVTDLIALCGIRSDSASGEEVVASRSR